MLKASMLQLPLQLSNFQRVLLLDWLKNPEKKTTNSVRAWFDKNMGEELGNQIPAYETIDSALQELKKMGILDSEAEVHERAGRAYSIEHWKITPIFIKSWQEVRVETIQEISKLEFRIANQIYQKSVLEFLDIDLRLLFNLR